MRVQLVKGEDAPYGYRVPNGFLLVAVDGRGEPTYRPSTTWWIHAGRRDLFGIARAFGYAWTWDEHDDGTAAIVAAHDYLTAHAGAVAEIEIGDFAQEVPHPQAMGACRQGT